MSVDIDFMEAVKGYMEAAIEGQVVTNKLVFAIIDQITELTERTNDPDLIAGWAARVAMVSEKNFVPADKWESWATDLEIDRMMEEDLRGEDL